MLLVLILPNILVAIFVFVSRSALGVGIENRWKVISVAIVWLVITSVATIALFRSSGRSLSSITSGVVCVLVLGMAGGTWWFKEVRESSIRVALAADRRFISSSLDQYFLENPGETEISWSAFVDWGNERNDGRMWVSWEPEAIYECESLTAKGGTVKVLHPKLDEPVILDIY